MPEIQLFDFSYLWEVIKPFAIPVIIWFIFMMVMAAFIAAMRPGVLKQLVSGLVIITIPASIILFILVGLGTI